MIQVYLNNFVIDDELQISNYNKSCRIKVQGHSDWGLKGEDIVCSAVSAIVQTAFVSITEVAKIHQEISQKSGFLETIIDVKNARNAGRNALNTIISSMLIGINLINENYPDTIEIIFE